MKKTISELSTVIMKTMNKTSLEELLSLVQKWKLEASSPYNDGWTRQHYQDMLDKIQNSLGSENQPRITMRMEDD